MAPAPTPCPWHHRLRSSFTRICLFSLVATAEVFADLQVASALYTCGKVSYSLHVGQCGQPNFYGCYTPHRRERVFAQTPEAKEVPCGYQTPSGYDDVRVQLADLNCESVVYTGNFGGVGAVYLPQADVQYTEELGKICYVLIVDMDSYRLLSLEYLVGWNVAVVRRMPYENELAKSYKVLKILGARLFSESVQRTLFFDSNLIFRQQRPLSMFSLLGDRDMVAFKHPVPGRTTIIEIQKGKARILQKRQGVISADTLDTLDSQLRVYKAEEYDSTGMIESNVLIRSYSEASRGCMLLMECAWFGELHTFSYRDQPSAPYVLDKLNLWSRVQLLPFQTKASLVRKIKS